MSSPARIRALASELRRSGSVAGFDVTFSAPKSASVLFGIGDAAMQATIREAHQRAVASAFAYFDDAVSVARRGAGGLRKIEGRGLTAASFLHRTSRAGDPQLHTHVVVANLVQGSDGSWSALDGRLVYAHARTAGLPLPGGAARRAHAPPRRPMATGAERHGRDRRHAGEGAASVLAASGRDRGGDGAPRVGRRRSRADRGARARGEPRTGTSGPSSSSPSGASAPPTTVCTSGGSSASPSRPRSSEQPDWEHFSRAGGAGRAHTRPVDFGRRDVIQALSCGAPTTARRSRAIRAVADAFLDGPNVVRLLGSPRATASRSTRRPSCCDRERVIDAAARLRASGARGPDPRATEPRSTRGRSSPTSSARWCAGSLRTATASCRDRARRNRQDDRASPPPARHGSESGSRYAAARSHGGRRASSSRRPASARRASRACCADRAPCRQGTVLVARRGRDARHPRPREAARLSSKTPAASSCSPETRASCHRSRPAARSSALSARLDPIELQENRRQRARLGTRRGRGAPRSATERALGVYERHGRLHVGRHDERSSRR